VEGSGDGAAVMTAMDPFVAGPPADRSRPWRVVSDGSLSNGMALGDARIAPGAPGPGRHVHTHEDEGIYVVTGVLTVEVGEERYEVGAESFVWLPREVPHVFANLGTEEVWTVGLLSSPGLTGMFHEQAEYFASLQGPPDPEVLLEISLRYGVRPVEGPPLV
jgi:mannose-6-phosphate isomerase-like protein (cupin superfamily)